VGVLNCHKFESVFLRIWDAVSAVRLDGTTNVSIITDGYLKSTLWNTTNAAPGVTSDKVY